MLTYFFQVNLCWLMFYGLYWALLSCETFFKLNRIYLIITLLGGLALPLVANWLHEGTALVLPFEGVLLPVFEFSIQGNGLSVVDSPTLLPVGRGWSWWMIISIIYFMGVLMEICRFLMGLFKLYSIHKTAQKEVKSSYTLLVTEGVCQPFSFFKYIFVSHELLQSADFQNIMRHELAHVRQKHSWDVIVLEVIQIVFWLSPCVYLYKNSLRNVHEYLADAAVLRSVSKRQYGSLLIQQSQAGKSIAFVNPFFSQLKKRILMMTRNPSKRRSLVKYTLAAPILLVLVILLATPENPVMAETAHISNEIKSTITHLEIPTSKTPREKVNITDIKNQPVKPTVRAFVNSKGGVISTEDFKKFDGLIIIDEQTGKELSCTKISYVLVMIPKDADPMQANVYAKISNDAVKLASYAKDGTQYSFLNIKVQLAGETEMRDLGSMSFFIGGKKLQSKLNDTTDITRAELDKISPNDIASVNVKKSENGRSEIIIVLKNGKIFRTYPSEIDIKNKPVSKTEGEVKITLKEVGESQVFTVVEELPEFPQGQAALFKWLGENIRYPAVSRENGIQGTVYIGFIVEKDGSITDITVKRGVKGIVRDTVTIMEVNGIKGNKYVEREDHSIDNEAKRVIAAMPKWKPGKNKGVPVRVAYTLPIKFKLE